MQKLHIRHFAFILARRRKHYPGTETGVTSAVTLQKTISGDEYLRYPGFGVEKIKKLLICSHERQNLSTQGETLCVPGQTILIFNYIHLIVDNTTMKGCPDVKDVVSHGINIQLYVK